MATTHYPQRPSTATKRQLAPHTRTTRLAPLKRGSYSKGTKSAPHSPVRVVDEYDDSMAASFLQFCAACEKQINVPSNALLYCSESCRKRDNKANYSPPRTPYGSVYAPEVLPRHNIVTPRSPTVARSSNRSSIAYSSDTDEEPTSQDAAHHSRQGSEAARYLRQFQNSTSTVTPTDKSSRPRYHRSQSAAQSAAPSLSHTPHSISSIAGMPFTPSTNTSRPLPPRKNPYSSSYGSRSIDLVTPFTALTMTDAYGATAPAYNERTYGLKSTPSSHTCRGAVAEGEISYEKREALPASLSSPGSLGALFAGQSTPHAKWG